MRILKNFIIALVAATAIVACNKEKSDPQPQPASEVVGKYDGLYGFGDDLPDAEMKIEIKPGGVFQEIGANSGAPTGEGTWQLNGHTLTATYTMLYAPFTKYSINATFNPDTKELGGTWGWDNNPSDGGKLIMHKL